MPKKWTAAQRKKFKATVAAKKKAVQSFPIALLPDQEPVRISKVKQPKTAQLERVQLAIAVIQLLNNILGPPPK